MIAKIIQGTDFNGVINYMLNKPDDKAKVLAATGVRIASANKAVLPQSKNWKGFVAGLEQQGITTHFKTKGNTDVVQGIIFVKDGCSFSGSKIDRSCSFDRLNETLNQNSQQQRYEELAQVSKEVSEGSSNFLTELSEALVESFTLPTSNAGVDVDEIRFQKKLRNRANRQRKI